MKTYRAHNSSYADGRTRCRIGNFGISTWDCRHYFNDSTYLTALRIGQRIKKSEPKIITVFGGYHVSALPEETLADEAAKYVDRAFRV
jgi:hypothetical protein